ncbi:MAG: cupin domain-containing protein [Janthinobacterium lividum]
MSPRAGFLLPGLPLLALAGLVPVTRSPFHPAPPSILCSVSAPGGLRPSTTVQVLRTEGVGDGSDWRITTLLVSFPPHAFTPRHVHGGALTAYVLSGGVRSQLNDGPVAELRQGDTFHEAVGTIHSFIENPDDEPASVLATIIHPPDAPLTTMLLN